VSLSEISGLNAEAVLTACLADLDANAPAEDIAARLRAIDAQTTAPPALRARFLRARAIATRRLGFPNEALGDLYEAARLLNGEPEHRERSDIFRTIALVQGWSGDGREAALALLRAVADAAVPNDRQAIALTLAEAGRLAMEIRRPHDAQALFACALDVGGPDLSDRERRRASVNLLQALVAAGKLDGARACLDGLLPVLAGASARLRFLVEVERVRIARAAGDFKEAHAALARAAALLPDNPEAFEHVEFAEAEAELALAENNAARAAELIDKVVTRCATDDLAGREVAARLLQARVFEALERPDDAERTLAAALRRARARALRGHADEVRSAIASRGGAESAWIPGETSAAPIEAELTRRFVRRKTLGTGGFGSVVRAYDLELGTEVALKRSTLENIFDTAQRSRLLEAARTEVAAASRIEHPGVARIYGMLVEGDREALLIEEFVEGETLRAGLAKFDLPHGLDLLARLSYALSAVHAAGVVHRDFKPDNVILRPNGAPVLVDFGIALTAADRDRKGKGGTPFYVAPEQAAGRITDARADLYALGVVAHELLLKKRPEVPSGTSWLSWVSSGISARRRELVSAGLPGEVADLIARLLAPHPRWRPRTAAEAGACFAAAAAAP